MTYYQQLFIAGRNIAARTLYGLTIPGDDWPGSTPEELAADYHLPLEAIKEAIAYCKANPPEMLADWEMEEAVLKASQMHQGNGEAAGNFPMFRRSEGTRYACMRLRQRRGTYQPRAERSADLGELPTTRVP